MVVGYRLVEEWWAEEGIWVPWGMFYENCSGMFPERTLLTQAIPDDDRRKARYFGQRIEQYRPTIEEAAVVLGEYADRYRILPDIRTVEGADHHEIFTRLWDILFEEMEKRRAERRLVYTAPQPAYHAVREQSSETDDEG